MKKIITTKCPLISSSLHSFKKESLILYSIFFFKPFSFFFFFSCNWNVEYIPPEKIEKCFSFCLFPFSLFFFCYFYIFFSPPVISWIKFAFSCYIILLSLLWLKALDLIQPIAFVTSVWLIISNKFHFFFSLQIFVLFHSALRYIWG